MVLAGFTPLEWLALVEHELLLFAGIFFLVGGIDEIAVDAVWIVLRLAGKAYTPQIDRSAMRAEKLRGRAAVLIPTWREAEVIGATIAHALAAWPQEGLRLYVGCYCNDPETAEAVIRAGRGDPRLRLVIHGNEGPTTKADCLNRLYAAICADEERLGEPFRMVLLHDAEDMVDAAALGVLDVALDKAEFIQLPVLPEPQPDSHWIAGHYCEEFAEAHGKAMVVRDALAAGLPAAGVGCAFARPILARLASERHGTGGPFSVESLTEDYELGLSIKSLGGRQRFLRARGEDGALVATRACFPARLVPAVRQKTRWVHGIALQGWDRLGWSMRPAELWMRMRDRRGPLTAIVLAAGYLLLVISTILWAADVAGYGRPFAIDRVVQFLLVANFVSFGWRALMRFAFTTREYGFAEGLRALMRIPMANVISIMAGRRALLAYIGTLGGSPPQWDKTHHDAHPALMRERTA